MREVVLDTETTGLDPQAGHRLVEVGAVELSNHVPTGRTYHQYINPDRSMPKDAFKIHGLSDEFLSDKPKFADVADDFLEFLGEGKLVIHNAAFDLGFINAELGWIGRPQLSENQVIDTVAVARNKFPGSPASLDALSRRFGIDTSDRVRHGALLDSEILAEVYLELVGGRQPNFAFTMHPIGGTDPSGESWRPGPRGKELPLRITDAEAKAHVEFVESLGEGALWRKYDS